MGGGVALFDANGDSNLDIYFIQSGGPFESDIREPNKFYLNDGSANFTLKQNSGAEDTGYGMGVATGDYDRDGDVDLFVTNVGENRLLQNTGNGQFSDVTKAAGVYGSNFSTSATFLDVDRDGFLDLFVTNYVDWNLAIERKCYDYGTGARNYCDPGNYDKPSADVLYRNNGDGTFNNVSPDSGIYFARGNGLGVVATDVDGDGWVDIYVANDQTPNHLWMNQRDFTFKEEGFIRGAAMDDHGIAKAGMGVLAEDINGNQMMDLIVVNIQGETDSVYQNKGDYFEDGTARFGLTRFSRNYTRFGIALADFNGDSLLDFYQGNGKVTFSPESPTSDPYAEPNALFRGNKSGDFEYVKDPACMSEQIHTSRAVAKGDLNNDGLVDLVVVNRDAAPYVLLNDHPSSVWHKWLTVNLLESHGAPALNATLQFNSSRVTRRFEVQVGGSYLAANASPIYASLPFEIDIHSATVEWPNGVKERFAIRQLNQTVTFTQGMGQGLGSLDP